MKKVIFIIIFLSITSSTLFAQELPYAWNFTTQPITATTGSSYNITSSTIDNSGNFYMTGYFVGTCDFDPSNATSNLVSADPTVPDIFFAKYSSQGLLIGTPKRIGNTNIETPGNVFYDNGTSSIYLTGSFTGTVDFNPSGAVNNLVSLGLTDAFIARYDTDGNYLGAYSVGGTLADAGSIVRIHAGDVYVTGTYSGTVDFDITAGVSNLTSLGAADIFFARYTLAGSLVWVKSIGSVGNESPGYFRLADNAIYLSTLVSSAAVDFDPGAGVTSLTGFNGTTDFAFAKYDLSGNLNWARMIGGAGLQFGNLYAIDGSDLYIAGQFEQTVDLDPGAGVTTATSTSGYDGFLCRINTSGDLVWSKTWSSPGATTANIQQVLPNNTLLVTGSFEGSIDLDPNGGVFNQTSNGLSDGFFLRMTTTGNFMDGFSIGGADFDGAPGAISDISLTKIFMSAFCSSAVDVDPTTDVNGPVAPFGFFASGYTLLPSVPTAQPTGLNFNTPTADSFNFSFTAASGSPDGYVVIRRPLLSPTGVPKDGRQYFLGDQIGDGYVVQSSASLTGSSLLMSANTAYYFDVYAYNGSGASTNYFTTLPLEGSTTTSAITYNRISDSLALVTLYNAMGGASWTNNNNWLSANPITTWFGISPTVGNRVDAINLGSNNLTGQVPAAIANLTALQTLALNNNSITGSLPSEIGDLVNLKNLALYSNSMSGTLPSTLGNITGLLYFDISTNQLTGTIPTSFSNLTSLNFIGLGGNKLSGIIDPIKNLTTLDEIYLWGNQFTGSIPPELGSMPGLIKLNLSSNKLSGTIPIQLGNLTNLQELSLHTNDITGSLPTELGDLTNLTDLRISFTKVSGAIPASLGNLINLSILYLGFNEDLTGAVPASFTNLTSLTQFEVQDNKLDDLPNLSALPLANFRVQNNKFTFEDLEPNISKLGASTNYAPQANYGTPSSATLNSGQTINLVLSPGGANNIYQWKFNGNNIGGALAATYSKPLATTADGGVYTLQITNSLVTGLTLLSDYQQVEVLPAFPTTGTLFDLVDAGAVSIDGKDLNQNDANGILYYGGIWGDFNNDGFDDLYLNGIGNSQRNFIYRNNGNGTFSRLPNAAYQYETHRNPVWGDYNNDGFIDLFTPDYQAFAPDSTDGFARVYRNQGNETFTSATAIGLKNDNDSGGTWMDADNDGDLDLITSSSTQNSFLFRNDGGIFTPVSNSFETGSTWGVTTVDIDNDGDMDVFHPSDNATQRQRQLYRNNGNGTFTRLSTNLVVTDLTILTPRGGSWADIDNDGDYDFYAMEGGSSTDGNLFFINDGVGNFTRSTSLSVLGEKVQGGRGCSFGDFNNDGYLDLITIQNLAPAGTYLYLNNGNGTFTKEVTQVFKLTGSFSGFSLSDYNNDGFQDIFTAYGGPDYNSVYKNKGNANNWLQVKLQGTSSNRDGIGAKVSVKAGGFWRHNQVLTSNGFANQNSLVQQFGLGSSTVADSVKVKWPSGFQQTFVNVASNQRTLITEVNSDSLALVALYNSTNGPGWTNKTNWLTGPLNTWYGVTMWFGANANKVRSILLSGNNLNGSLPTQMSDLTELEQLDVLNNKLTGTFPMQLTSLTKLKALYLGTNQFTGTLPIQIGNLVDLYGLGLDANQFTGPIPSEIGNLTDLVYLGLGNNQLSGAVPASFNNLDLLQSLYMPNNNLSVLPNLTGMAAITLMMVDVNNFTFEDIQPNVAIPGISYCCQKQVPVGGTISAPIGSPLNLSASIGGTGNVYQWKKFGTNIIGATSNTFTVASSTISDAGTYSLQITNPAVPTLTLQTTNFIAEVTALNAGDDSGYTFLKKLGAEALGLPQINTGGRAAIDNLGNYYFVSAANTSNGSEIQKADPSGNLLFTVSSGNPDIGGTDIAIDGQNSIYVPGVNYLTLKKYNSSGTLVFETPAYSGNRPFQTIDVDLDGSILTMDLNGGVSGRIKRFDSATGNLIGQISLTGGPVGSYSNVFDFDLDASGNIYVPDGNRIDKFSPAGVFISSIDVSMLNSWGGVILQVADNGHLYAATWFVGNIYHFDDTGNLLGNFGFDNNGFRSIYISSSNEIIASSGIGILKFDLNGSFLGFAEPRNANGQFNAPNQIAHDSNGFRYVADRYNHRIQKFTASGDWVANIGTIGSGTGQFNQPGSIAIDKSDNLYVTDDKNNRVQKFNSSGTHLFTIGSAGTGNGQFTNPVNVAVSKTGEIVVADKGNSRVQIFNDAGVFVSTFGTVGTGQGQFTNLQTLAIENDGTILTADGQARLQRFTPQGLFISELSMYGPVTAISKISTDIDGFIYIPTGGVVKKFDKSGGLITNIGIAGTTADGVLKSVSVSSNLAGDTLWIADNITTNRISIFTANFRKATTSDSLVLVDLYNSTNGAAWTTNTNWLTGSVDTWYGVQMSGGKIRKLHLPTNLLDGPLPASLATLDNLLSLKMNGNKISGTLTDWNVGSPLKVIDLSGNKLTQIGNLKATNLSLDSLAVQNNNLTFEDLEPNISIAAFTYSPQDSTGIAENILKQLTESISFTNSVAGTSVQYQWKKDDVVIPTATADTFTIPAVQFADEATYRLEATSALVPGLTLTSSNKILRVSSLVRDSIALRALYDSADGTGWTNKSNWLSTSLGSGNWFGVTVANNRVTQLNLSNNNLSGKVPPQFANLKELTSVDLSSNKISILSDLSSLPAITSLKLENNQLDFGDLEANVSIAGITYTPQDSVSTYENVLRQLGESQTFTSNVSGTANAYQWKKNGIDITETVPDLVISNISFNDDATYSFDATSSIVTGLTLSSAKKILRVSSLERDEIALTKLFIDTDGPNWIRNDNWTITPLATDNWFGVTIANNRVTQVNLPNNNLKGPITAIVADIQNLVSLDLSENKITSLPDLTSYPSISTLNVSKNNLDFASLEKNAGIAVINYSDQGDLGTPLDTLVEVGSPIIFELITGGTTNSYQWKRNGQEVPGATASDFEVTAIGRSNMGDYICEVTNSIVPGLTLKSTTQRAKAVATISGQLQIDATTPVTKGQMILLKIKPVGLGYDTTQVNDLNTDGTYKLEKVVLDDYILLGQADTITYKDYFPTYYNGSVFWEEADTIRLNENRTDVTYAVVALPTEEPKGVGELRGKFENEIEGGRIENRGRVAGASATVRRQTSAGRPGRTMAEDDIVAFLYTGEDGEFVFENLEEGFYKLNIQYPGVPMDEKSDLVITIGSPQQKQNIQEVTAVAKEGKIVVTRKVIVGVAEAEQASIQIYPNPVSTDLSINLTEGSGAGEMKMFDESGKEILSQQLKEGKSTFDLSTLSSGIYILKIYRGNNEVSAARVVVQ